MEYLQYPIENNMSINYWWTKTVRRTPIEAPYETFDAEVNLGEAYVQIVYPVRKAFLEGHDFTSIPYPQGPFENLVFPFENNRLDFSTFIHTPHHLSVEARTYIEVPKGGSYPFDIYTCGAVKLWIDGKEELIFSPFTRNIAQKQSITLELSQGRHELAVYLEELAERDVFFYLEIRYRGTLALKGSVPVEEEAAKYEQAMEFLRSLYLGKDHFEKGEVDLWYDALLLPEKAQLTCKSPAFGKQGKTLTLSPEAHTCTLGEVNQLPVGFFRFTFSLQVGKLTISRDLTAGLGKKIWTEEIPQATLLERKRQGLGKIAEAGEATITQALAICELEQRLTAQAHAMILTSLETIKAKADCSDFHLVPMLLLLTRYAHMLPNTLIQEIEESLLTYRYWLDEPGNDVMWFFSENHALLFHVGQYLAGSLFQKREFSVSKRSGAQQYALGKERLVSWFKTFFAYGYSEWNSATYIPIDLIGFFVLFEIAPDKEIRDMARKALDFTFRLIALNARNGVMGCSFGRCYEDTLKARQQTETTFLSWVAFGEGFISKGNRSVSLFCLSSYTCRPYTEEVRLQDSGWMEIQLKQGYNKVNTYLFRTPYYQMGCVQNYKRFTHGHQQHLFDVSLGAKMPVQYFINHPGERAFSGENRPSYWAGNGTMPAIHQYRNLALMIFNIDLEEQVHAIHAYAPLVRFDAYACRGQHFFFSCDDAYVSTWFSNPWALTKTGANAHREIISEGRVHAVVVRCASIAEYASFEQFVAEQEAQSKIFFPDQLKIICKDSHWGEIVADADLLTVNALPIHTDYPREATLFKGRFSHD